LLITLALLFNASFLFVVSIVRHTATRVLCQEGVYEAFIEKLAAKAKAVGVARTPEDSEALYGPLNNERQMAAVKAFFDTKPSHARVVTGGAPLDGPGFFFAPTVVADLQQDDDMIQKEIFAPVITVQKFSTEAEAILMGNGVEYGLASSVFTKDHGRALRVSRALDFGCVWINTHIPLVAEMPHGGFNKSGYGKDLSTYGFDEYTRVKHVMSSLGE
jgi:betaine-aldehyde dehydrogenase